MIRAGREIAVTDATTGEDLTAMVLAQIILEKARSRRPSSAYGVLTPTHPVWRGVARLRRGLSQDQFGRHHDQSARGGAHSA